MIAYGGCPILNTASEADDTHKVLFELTKDAIKLMKMTISDLIKEGKKNSEIGIKADEEKIAEVMISLIEGGVFLSKVTGKKSYLMNSMDQIDHLIHSMTE